MTQPPSERREWRFDPDAGVVWLRRIDKFPDGTERCADLQFPATDAIMTFLGLELDPSKPPVRPRPWT